MAWCMNMYARIDAQRVLPFVFTVRQWARQVIPDHESRKGFEGLTPFMVTCLAFFYLMRVRPRLIPPLQVMTRKYPGE